MQRAVREGGLLIENTSGGASAETGDKERPEAGEGTKEIFGVVEMLEAGWWPQLHNFT